MIVGSTTQAAGTPAWRHCLPYVLLALALHVAILLLVRANWPDAARPSPPPVTVDLKPAPVPAPVPVPVRLPAPVSVAQSPVRAKPQAAAATQRAPAATVSARPAPAAVADEAPSAAPVVAAAADGRASGAAGATFPARFDAAYLNNPRPHYPPVSRRLGEQGKVLLRVRVGADGQALAVDLEKSSNFERLDESARQVVTRWRFVPARRGDEAVEGAVIVPIVFRLDD